MICPNCNATNGETNRFCRECGFRLEGTVPPVSPESPGAPAPDEVALGQQLFKVWQLFESGDLDSALREGVAIIRSNPESASAHSLVALIYERKAEEEQKLRGMESALPIFKLAIAQYERIIDLNPDSTADREKLASLRAGLAAQSTDPVRVAPAGFAAALRAVPPQFLAAFAGFLVVLIVLIIFIPGRGKGSGRAPSGPVLDAERLGVPATQGAPQAPPEQPLNIYTFRSSPTVERPVPTPPEAQAAARTSEPAKPAPAQSIPPELKIVPEPAAAVKPAQSSQQRSPVVSGAAESRPDPDVPASGGSTMLARAIELHNVGRDAEAVSAAQQAIAAYQADIDAGRDVTNAQRGIANARKLTRVWQQSIVVTAEEE